MNWGSARDYTPKKLGLCGRRDCTNPEALNAHTCPYQSDINNDNETLCRCCDACTQSCAEDI